MSYIETSPAGTIDRGRRNTNESLESLLDNFAGSSPPTSNDFTRDGANFTPPLGMLHYNTQRNKFFFRNASDTGGSIIGNGWVPLGTISVENNYAAMIANTANYRRGDLVVTAGPSATDQAASSLYQKINDSNAASAWREVGSANIAAKGIVELMIADSAVVNRCLAEDAVETDNIKDRQVTGAKAALNTFDNENMKAKGILGDSLGDGIMDKRHFPADCLPTIAYEDDSIPGDAMREVNGGDIVAGSTPWTAMDSSSPFPDSIVGDNTFAGGKITNNTTPLNKLQTATGASTEVGAALKLGASNRLDIGSPILRKYKTLSSGDSSIIYSLPSYFNEINVLIYRISFNTNAHVLIQFGSDSDWFTTVYNSEVEQLGAPSRHYTNGLAMDAGGASETCDGRLSINRVDGNYFVASGVGHSGTGADGTLSLAAGTAYFSSNPTRIRIRATDSGTFDGNTGRIGVHIK